MSAWLAEAAIPIARTAPKPRAPAQVFERQSSVTVPNGTFLLTAGRLFISGTQTPAEEVRRGWKPFPALRLAEEQWEGLQQVEPRFFRTRDQDTWPRQNASSIAASNSCVSTLRAATAAFLLQLLTTVRLGLCSPTVFGLRGMNSRPAIPAIRKPAGTNRFSQCLALSGSQRTRRRRRRNTGKNTQKDWLTTSLRSLRRCFQAGVGMSSVKHFAKYLVTRLETSCGGEAMGLASSGHVSGPLSAGSLQSLRKHCSTRSRATRRSRAGPRARAASAWWSPGGSPAGGRRRCWRRGRTAAARR